MQWGYAPFLYFVAVLGLEAAMQKECRIIEALQNKLTYRQRLQYMKHYFPINYTVNVQFEEVLKAANITRLGNVDANVQGVVEQVLTGDAGSSQKAVPPKALLDNCVKVMWLLYSESWPRGSQHPTKHLPRCPAVGALPCSPREE
nr:interleukin-34 isoform X3 [Caretta caretta]